MKSDILVRDHATETIHSPLASFWLKGIPILVFLFFALVYPALRSKELFSVDGNYRCFEVYQRKVLFFHSNNHMLYPVDVLVWTRMVSALGIEGREPLQFFSIVEMMNCFAGAGCLAILYLLIYLANDSWFLALMITIGYGLSTSFIGQATGANEPMLAVFWSFLAVLFAALTLKVKSLWPAMVSGLLFSVALATYQSMVLLAPAGLFLTCQTQSRRWPRIGAFVLSGFAGCVSIYAWAYWHLGIRTIPAMIRHFFVHDEGRAFVGVTVGKVLTVPIGMVSSIFPLLHFVDFRGLRGLLAARNLSAICLIMLPVALCAFLVFSAVQVHKRWDQVRRSARIGLLAAAFGIAFTLVPLIIWDPIYDKLWIEPLACLAVLLAIALSVIRRSAGRQFVLFRVVSALLLIGTFSNLVWVVRYHSQWTPEMDQARQLAGMIGSKDLLVGDWDPVSTLYSSIWIDDRPTEESDRYRSLWAQNEHFISFTTEATIYGIGIMPRLREAIAKSKRNGGRVFFLNLLDESKPAWDSFFDKRCGVPYSEMQLYRDHSVVVAKFQVRTGEVVLRQFREPRFLSRSETELRGLSAGQQCWPGSRVETSLSLQKMLIAFERSWVFPILIVGTANTHC